MILLFDKNNRKPVGASIPYTAVIHIFFRLKKVATH